MGEGGIEGSLLWMERNLRRGIERVVEVEGKEREGWDFGLDWILGDFLTVVVVFGLVLNTSRYEDIITG